MKKLSPLSAQNAYTLSYFALHLLVSCALLFNITYIIPNPKPDAVFLIGFFTLFNAALLLLLHFKKLDLRLLWAIITVILLYFSMGFAVELFAVNAQNKNFILYILQQLLMSRYSVLLSSVLLLSTSLIFRFPKLRSIEAAALLLATIQLLTSKSYSEALEENFQLYRWMWILLPLASIVLLYLSNIPQVKNEVGWKAPSTKHGGIYHNGTSKNQILRQRFRYFSTFLALLLILFAILWFTKISPLDISALQNGSGRGNGLLKQNYNNQFDFDNYLRLDPKLEQDQELVMMVKIEQLSDNNSLYLKRFTLSAFDEKRSFHYDKNEIHMLGESPLPYQLLKGKTELLDPGYDFRQQRSVNFYLLNINPSALFAIDYPTEITTFETWDNASFSRVYSSNSQSLSLPYYQNLAIKSYPSAIDKQRLDYYTSGSPAFQNLQAYALQIIGASGLLPSTEAKASLEEVADIPSLEVARAIEGYFHQNFRYSLNPGIAPDGDQLRYFLFQSKKGYCTYFAYSAGLMLRSLGVPTRVVVGFLVNPELRILDFYPLFADQAHAWLEVYDPAQGWVTFDPTTFLLAPGEDLQFGIPDSAKDELGLLTEELLENPMLTQEDGENQISETSDINQSQGGLMLILQESAIISLKIFIFVYYFFALLYRLIIYLMALKIKPRGKWQLKVTMYCSYLYVYTLLREKPRTKVPPRKAKQSLSDYAEELAEVPLFSSYVEQLQKYYFAEDFNHEDLVITRMIIYQLAHSLLPPYYVRIAFLFWPWRALSQLWQHPPYRWTSNTAWPAQDPLLSPEAPPTATSSDETDETQ